MKIYAKQVTPEHQESPLFFGDWPENVFVFGNRHYIERAEKLNETRDALERIAETLEDMQAGCAYTNNLHAAIWCELPRESGSAYTRAERFKILELAEEYAETGTRDENDVLCDALELSTGIEFYSGTIRGCCQGDWQNIIYPAEYGREWLNAFEMEYFNTGTEWRISEGEPDTDDYYFYAHEWSDDGIKKEIAAAAGVNENDVILYTFEGYSQTPIYKEVSA